MRKTVSEVSAKDVLQGQGQVMAIEQSISALNQAIALEQGKIDQANAGGQVIIDLTREIEDLMAAQAIGEQIDNERLHLAKKQLADEKANAQQAQSSADQAVGIISGLRRKVAAADQELKASKTALNDLHLGYLYSLAETEGREYKKLADALMKKLLRLTALGKIIEKCPKNESLTPIYSGWNEKLYIPGFDLDACRGSVQGGIWCLARYDAAVIPDEVVAVKAGIEEAGIQIPR